MPHGGEKVTGQWTIPPPRPRWGGGVGLIIDRCIGDSLCDLRTRARAKVRARAKCTSRGPLFHNDPGFPSSVKFCDWF